MVTPKSPDPRRRRSNPFDTEDEDSELWKEDGNKLEREE